MKASVYIATSLDGMIAGKEGSLEWLPPIGNNGEDYGYHAFMEGIDAIVMGRRTFETVLGFGGWHYGKTRVVVMSRSMETLPAGLPETVELHPGPAEAVWHRLKESGARHLYIDGGKTIQGFLRAGLIGELILTRVPVLLGEGTPLFGQLDHPVSFDHIKTQSFPNGLVQSHYTIKEG